MLQQLLALKANEHTMISFVGAGGKTTALMTLSREMRHLRRLITTTTAFYMPDPTLWDEMVTGPKLNYCREDVIKGGAATVWGGSFGPDNKLRGVPLDALQQVYASGQFDLILVEADGSKHKPIKAPMDHEPVIPESTTMVIGVIGLSALNKPVNEKWVHRMEPFMSITGAVPNELVCPEHVVKLVLDKNGLFKGTPAHAVKVLLLNQADTAQEIHLANMIIQQLKEEKAGVCKYIITSFDNKTYTMVWGEGH